jgi:hypothetical protein
MAWSSDGLRAGLGRELSDCVACPETRPPRLEGPTAEAYGCLRKQHRVDLVSVLWLVQGRPLEVGPVEVGPLEVGINEVGPLEVGPVEVGPAEVGPNEVGPVEVGVAEVKALL